MIAILLLFDLSFSTYVSSRHDQLKAQIEAKKKKRLKYNEKMKEIEELREKEANKWKHFQHKVICLSCTQFKQSINCPTTVWLGS